jgi:glutamyl-tRNA synthetase
LAYFGDQFSMDEAAVRKFLSDGAVRQMLAELGEQYAGLREFTEASTEELLRGYAAEKGVKAGVLINGARVALTGQAVAPSLFAVMLSLGQQTVVHRLKAAEALAVQ